LAGLFIFFCSVFHILDGLAAYADMVCDVRFGVRFPAVRGIQGKDYGCPLY
jgi:hypothetical protein